MSLGYKPALDGLRALAVVAVVCVHTSFPVFLGGGRGVDLFFVLSGFLITSILKTEAGAAGSIDLLRFWVRRARRLAPALFAMLATYVCLAPMVLPQFAGSRWIEAFFAAAYLTDYSIFVTGARSPLAHTWSLAIEEQFYLLWPLLLGVVLRLRSPSLVLTGVWGALTIVRIVIYGSTLQGADAYYPLHAHSTGLVLGAALALAPSLPRLGWAGVPLLAFVMLTAGDTNADIIWRIPVAEVGTAMLITELLRPSRLARIFAWEPFRRLGLISYGVYLWHLPIRYVLEPLAPVEKGLLTLGLSILIASASYWSVERWTRAPPRGTAQLVPA